MFVNLRKLTEVGLGLYCYMSTFQWMALIMCFAAVLATPLLAFNKYAQHKYKARPSLPSARRPTVVG